MMVVENCSISNLGFPKFEKVYPNIFIMKNFLNTFRSFVFIFGSLTAQKADLLMIFNILKKLDAEKTPPKDAIPFWKFIFYRMERRSLDYFPDKTNYQ